MTAKREVVRFLQKNGVETRFVSIIDEKVYINNLKLSRFSRKREELFLENFPNFEVRRSKVFQRICTRSSRVLKNALSPHDRVLLTDPADNKNCVNLAMHVVLEPYARKYGVELITVPGLNLDDLNENELHGVEGDAVAIPLTLDGEIEHILGLMLNGEKLDILSSHTVKNGMKMIYPLINVPQSWIESWIKIEDSNCACEDQEGLNHDMLEFLEDFIPDVREKMMKSAGYLYEQG